jgi:hypothetical protein
LEAAILSARAAAEAEEKQIGALEFLAFIFIFIYIL